MCVIVVLFCSVTHTPTHVRTSAAIFIFPRFHPRSYRVSVYTNFIIDRVCQFSNPIDFTRPRKSEIKTHSFLSLSLRTSIEYVYKVVDEDDAIVSIKLVTADNGGDGIDDYVFVVVK